MKEAEVSRGKRSAMMSDGVTIKISANPVTLPPREPKKRNDPSELSGVETRGLRVCNAFINQSLGVSYPWGERILGWESFLWLRAISKGFSWEWSTTNTLSSWAARASSHPDGTGPQLVEVWRGLCSLGLLCSWDSAFLIQKSSSGLFFKWHKALTHSFLGPAGFIKNFKKSLPRAFISPSHSLSSSFWILPFSFPPYAFFSTFSPPGRS